MPVQIKAMECVCIDIYVYICICICVDGNTYTTHTYVHAYNYIACISSYNHDVSELILFIYLIKITRL